MRTHVVIFYALPALVFALPTIPVTLHLTALYGAPSVLGLAITGLVLLIARIFDTVTDPLVGILCDRFSWRGTIRKPWILAGAVIAGCGLFKVLNPPADITAAYLLGWSVVLYAGWTMIAVPYMAWGAELSGEYDERTRITSWREGFALVGIVGAAIVTAILADQGWSQARSIGAIAWAAIGLGAIVVPLLMWGVPESPGGSPGGAITPVAANLPGLRQSLTALALNRPFLRLAGAWFVNGIANGIPAALFFIYLDYGLGAGEKERPLFVLVYFVSAILALPVWQMLSRRVGKHRAWCWAMLLACAAFVVVPWIPPGQFTAFAVVCVVTGAALGADLVLPPAIQADVVDYGHLRAKNARAGLYFAFWGMSTKLALALAVGLALPGLDLLGFDQNEPTQAGRNLLTGIYALIPVILKLAAVGIVWRFPLTSRKHTIIRRRLDRRTAGG